jgi:hypothetical protein
MTDDFGFSYSDDPAQVERYADLLTRVETHFADPEALTKLLVDVEAADLPPDDRTNAVGRIRVYMADLARQERDILRVKTRPSGSDAGDAVILRTTGARSRSRQGVHLPST